MVSGLIAAKIIGQKHGVNAGKAKHAEIIQNITAEAVQKGLGMKRIQLASLSIPRLAGIAAHAAWNIVYGPNEWLTKRQTPEDASAEAGMKPARIKWSADKVKVEIQKLDEVGLPLESRYAQINHSALYGAAVRYFGSWKEAVTTAGYDYDSVAGRHSIEIGANVTVWGRLERMEITGSKEDMIIGQVNKDGKIESNSSLFPVNIGSFTIGKEYAGQWVAGALKNDENHGVVLEFFTFDSGKTGKRRLWQRNDKRLFHIKRQNNRAECCWRQSTHLGRYRPLEVESGRRGESAGQKLLTYRRRRNHGHGCPGG